MSGQRTKPSQRRVEPVAAVLLTGMVALWAGFMIWLGLPLFSDAQVPSSLPPSSPASAPSSSPLLAPTYPPEMLAMAQAVSTYYAPTPTPTPAPPRPTPTPKLTSYCGISSAPGDICEWPEPPLPTATPWAVCWTPVPGELCEWRGMSGPARTPVATTFGVPR